MPLPAHWIVLVLVHGYDKDRKKSPPPVTKKSGNKQHLAESLMMNATKKTIGRISEAQRACCALISVCKQWRDALKQEEQIWSKVALYNEFEANNVLMARCCIAAGSSLKSLDVRRLKELSDAGVREVARLCPNLEVCTMPGLSLLSDDGVISLAEGCKSLKQVDFSGCSRLGDVSAMSLSNNCKGLTHLDLSDAKALTDRGAGNIVTRLPRLKLLQLEACEKISDDILHKIGAQLIALTTLDLRGCGVRDLGALKSLSQLEWLSVADCVEVQDLDIEALFSKKCGSKLIEFSVSGCRALTTSALSVIIDSCPRLEALGIRDLILLDSESVEIALSRLNRLMQIELDGCEFLRRSQCKRWKKNYPRIKGLKYEHWWPVFLDVFIDNWTFTLAVIFALSAVFAQYKQFWFVTGPFIVCVLFYGGLGKAYGSQILGAVLATATSEIKTSENLVHESAAE